MTATVEQRPDSEGFADRGSAMASVAVRFAERGWPVLPGSTFDGRRYVEASTYRVASGLRPVLPRDQASTDAGTVARWWRVKTALLPSVLLRTGQAFDAVVVSRDLALETVQTSVFRDAPGPVILRPDQGRAYFLIGRGESVLPPVGARPTVVEPIEPGAWIAAPPTRTAVGGVSWLVSPRSAGWAPTSAGVLAHALRVALPRVESAGWGIYA